MDQLIQHAESSLLIATYNIGLSSQFQDLLKSIADRLESGQIQRVELFFHPIQIADRLGTEPLKTIRQWFDKDVWPWPTKPLVYVDRAAFLRAGRALLPARQGQVADADTVRLLLLSPVPTSAKRRSAKQF